MYHSYAAIRFYLAGCHGGDADYGGSRPDMATVTNSNNTNPTNTATAFIHGNRFCGDDYPVQPDGSGRQHGELFCVGKSLSDVWSECLAYVRVAAVGSELRIPLQLPSLLMDPVLSPVS